MTGCALSQRVSPVKVFLRPTAATMSPAEHGLHVLTVIGVHPQQAARASLFRPA